MYCPRCGKPALSEQRFCRVCGLNLEQHAHLLVQPTPATELESAPTEQNQSIRDPHPGMKRAGFMMFFIGGVIALTHLVILMGMSNDLAKSPGPSQVWPLGIFMLSGLVACFIGFILSILAAKPSHKTSVEPTLAEWVALPPGLPTTRLSPDHQPESPLSVTEHTTELMDAPAANATVRHAARQREYP